MLTGSENAITQVNVHAWVDYGSKMSLILKKVLNMHVDSGITVYLTG